MMLRIGKNVTRIQPGFYLIEKKVQRFDLLLSLLQGYVLYVKSAIKEHIPDRDILKINLLQNIRNEEIRERTRIVDVLRKKALSP